MKEQCHDCEQLYFITVVGDFLNVLCILSAFMLIEGFLVTSQPSIFTIIQVDFLE